MSTSANANPVGTAKAVAVKPISRRTARLATAAVAALSALVVWVVAGPVLGVDFSVTKSGTTTEVGAGMVLATSAGAALAGWALLAVLERFTARARRIWVAVAVAVLVLSFVMPFNSGEIATNAKWTLLLLHVVVGAVVIPGLARTARVQA